MWNPKGRRRQSRLSARAIDSICPSWTLGWAHLPSNWCIQTLKENNYWTSAWRSTSYIGCLVLHKENWPFWRRYRPFSLTLHWRKKTLPTSKDHPAPKTSICPGMYLPFKNEKTSIDRSIARVCEGHQKALSMAATLEEEIERLCRKKAHSGPERRRRDSYGSKERSRKRQWEANFGSKPTASQSADPGMLSSRTGSEGRDSDLGDPPQLQAEVASFLQCSSKLPRRIAKEYHWSHPYLNPLNGCGES